LGIAFVYTAFITNGSTANGALRTFSGLPTLEVAQLYAYAIVVGSMDGTLVRVLFHSPSHGS
jgi:hypothetical protein